MAGDWIKMRSNLWDDPRVARIVDATDTSEAAVVGALYWLWATADQHTEDGILAGMSLRALDRKTGVQGFGEALVSVGWIADHPEGVRVVRFDEHNGKSAKRRCSESVRKMSARDADKLQTEDGQDAEGMQQSCAPREREREREDVNLTTANAVVVASPAEAELSTPDDGKFLPCPHDKVIALYHDALPILPRIREWTAARQQTLRSRWRAKCAELKWSSEADGLAWFSRFFSYVSESEFLCGRSQPPPGRTPFVADLEWLLKPANFTKVVEGKYHA